MKGTEDTLMESFIPSPLSLRRGFNYSYTNLSVTHKHRDLSTQSPLSQSRVSGLFLACAVSGLFRCCQFRLLQRFFTTLIFYVQIETSILSNKSQMWEKAIWEKGNNIWFQIWYKWKENDLYTKLSLHWIGSGMTYDFPESSP